jgi:hypothetical protein
MVSVFTKGRFANSTWQQMTGWVYAKKHGLEYCAPKESLAPSVWPTYHQHLQNPNWNPDLEIVEVNDGRHSFVELPFKEEWRDKNIMIGTKDIRTGYFQSWRYIDGWQSNLINEFNLSIGYHNAEYNTEMVIIHVRRGDYLQYSTKHPVVTDEYLLSAIHFIQNNFTSSWVRLPKFMFCSDDIPYCRGFVKKYFISSEDQFSFSIGTTQDDFIAMCNCPFLVTSNSSFSVLAGILNRHSIMVVCPHEDNYFGPDNSALATMDIMPPRWHRIKY